MSKRMVGKTVGFTDASADAPVGLVGANMREFTGMSRPRWWLLTLEVQSLADDVFLWGALPLTDDASQDLWGLHQDQYGKIPLGSLGSLDPGTYQFAVDGLGLYSRVALQVGGATQAASLDFGTLGGGLDTVIEAVTPGDGGLTVELVGDSPAAGGVTVDESGAPAIVIHYESGVSTVADVETEIGGAALIQVSATGTGATVLTAPADDVPATALTGGVTTIAAKISEILEAGRGN